MDVEAEVTVRVKVTHRGTSNGNQRGGSADRRRRREWLVETYRADVDVYTPLPPVALVQHPVTWPVEEDWAATYAVSPQFWVREKACRCYRCGKLLTVNTVTVDRIIPGCQGGTYARNNIRPACGTCNSSTGGKLAGKGSKK